MINSGFGAAQCTIDMMRATFNAIPPAEIVQVFIDFKGKPKERSEFLWKKFGTQTIGVMEDGAHLLAVLWESAWLLGDGETNVQSTGSIDKNEAMKICDATDFIPSLTIDRIGTVLESHS